MLVWGAERQAVGEWVMCTGINPDSIQRRLPGFCSCTCPPALLHCPCDAAASPLQVVCCCEPPGAHPVTPAQQQRTAPHNAAASSSQQQPERWQHWAALPAAALPSATTNGGCSGSCGGKLCCTQALAGAVAQQVATGHDTTAAPAGAAAVTVG